MTNELPTAPRTGSAYGIADRGQCVDRKATSDGTSADGFSKHLDRMSADDARAGKLESLRNDSGRPAPLEAEQATDEADKTADCAADAMEATPLAAPPPGTVAGPAALSFTAGSITAFESLTRIIAAAGEGTGAVVAGPLEAEAVIAIRTNASPMPVDIPTLPPLGRDENDPVAKTVLLWMTSDGEPQPRAAGARPQTRAAELALSLGRTQGEVVSSLHGRSLESGEQPQESVALELPNHIVQEAVVVVGRERHLAPVKTPPGLKLGGELTQASREAMLADKDPLPGRSAATDVRLLAQQPEQQLADRSWQKPGAQRGGTANETSATPQLGRAESPGSEVQPAPAQALSPMRQIADRIIPDMVGSGDGTGPNQPAATSGNAPAPLLKVLTIELRPPELGSVTVRLALNTGALTLQLEASRETSRVLAADKETLSNLLRAAGYAVDSIAVRVGEGLGPPAGGAVNASPNFLPQPHSGDARPDTGRSDGWVPGNRHHNDHDTRRGTKNEEDRARRRLDDGLYV
jgi:hypothetical protein